MSADTTDEYLRQVVGRKIVDVTVDEGGFGALILDDGTHCWIQCDSEGNGPGFLAIQKPDEED